MKTKNKQLGPLADVMNWGNPKIEEACFRKMEPGVKTTLAVTRRLRAERTPEEKRQAERIHKATLAWHDRYHGIK